MGQTAAKHPAVCCTAEGGQRPVAMILLLGTSCLFLFHIPLVFHHWVGANGGVGGDRTALAADGACPHAMAVAATLRHDSALAGRQGEGAGRCTALQ